tara:strand:+ start:199 stop:756 length:558 start_codon:yes stop_codon:yes gene_type:complete
MRQLDDFRPGKPGSPEVRGVLDYHGLFLLDPDRPYNNQALEALQRSHKAKKSQYDAVIKNLRSSRAATGVAHDDSAFDETLIQLGYAELARKIGVLKLAISKFQDAVDAVKEATSRTQLDPKRTVFTMEPPREFPSVAAMEFFLDQNAEIKAKHIAFTNQGKAEETEAPEPDALQDFIDSENKGV